MFLMTVTACEIRLNHCCSKCSCGVDGEGHYWCPVEFSESVKLPVLRELLLFTSTLLLLKDDLESTKLSVSLQSLPPVAISQLGPVRMRLLTCHFIENPEKQPPLEF